MQTAEIDGLIARVEGLTGPDREVDALVSAVCDGKTLPKYPIFHPGCIVEGGAIRAAPYLTASLDAVLALAERLLPGWAFFFQRIQGVVSRAPLHDCEAEFWLPAQKTQGLHFERARADHNDLVLAALLALLRAYRNKGSGARE